jgi:hypothetical protein
MAALLRLWQQQEAVVVVWMAAVAGFMVARSTDQRRPRRQVEEEEEEGPLWRHCCPRCQVAEEARACALAKAWDCTTQKKALV